VAPASLIPLLPGTRRSGQQKVEQAQALVDAIERALPAVADDRVRTDAEQLALEIRAASDSEAPKPGRFEELAAKAMTSLATSIATAAGSDLGCSSTSPTRTASAPWHAAAPCEKETTQRCAARRVSLRDSRAPMCDPA
jgi:hypothetical protein